jgi:hypothetical protein
MPNHSRIAFSDRFVSVPCYARTVLAFLPTRRLSAMLAVTMTERDYVASLASSTSGHLSRPPLWASPVMKLGS